MTTACAHPRWENDGRTGLKCVDCGDFWPGHPLPLPAHQVEGLGPLAHKTGWNQRLRDMVAELNETAAA